MSSTRIVVVDDHALMLGSIVRAISEADDMDVVGTASSGADVMAAVKRHKPDVVLLDLSLPAIDGMTCLEMIKRHHPDTVVIVLSAFDDRAHVNAALARGAAAYIVKTVAPADLAAVVRSASSHVVFSTLGPDEQVVAEPETAGAGAVLTARERTIVSALARGLSNKAISRELWVTEQTVKFHLNNVYRKLGVENRAAAVRWAFEHGLVERQVEAV